MRPNLSLLSLSVALSACVVFAACDDAPAQVGAVGPGAGGSGEGAAGAPGTGGAAPIGGGAGASGAAGSSGGQGNAAPQWAMHGANAQHSFRTPAVGAAKGATKWSFAVPGGGSNVPTPPVIAGDGTLYFSADFAVSQSEHGPTVYGPSYLYALNPRGEVVWSQTVGSKTAKAYYGYGSPVLGPDGTLYTAMADSTGRRLVAMTPAGKTIWSAAVEATTTPVVSNDGSVHVVDANGNLTSFAVDGTLRWSAPLTSASYGEPALGADGTVYIGAGGTARAFGADGTPTWTASVNATLHGTTSVGPDGTVYFSGIDSTENYHLFAFHADGSPSWDRANTSPPAIGADGTVYVAPSFVTPTGQTRANVPLAAIGADGKEKWSVTTSVRSLQGPTPTLDGNGTLYLSFLGDPSIGIADLVAIDSGAGKQQWATPEANDGESPVIAADGTFYLVTLDGKVVAVGP